MESLLPVDSRKVLLAALGSLAPAAASAKPNIVVMLTDDRE